MIDSNTKSTKFLKRPPRLGDVVQVKTTLQEGTVKFVGGIHFKSGTWVGIELFEHGSGKNNGTIKGVTYFKCPSQTGLLVMASSVNVLKPAQKIVTNSQKASLVSKTIYKQPKKVRKSISPASPISPNSRTESESNARKIKTLPRTSNKSQVIKVKPRPKSTQVVKSYSTANRMSKDIRAPAQTNININMTMTTNPKEKSIFLKNRINPKCEIEGDSGKDDSKNINDAIINGLQNTLVHLKDIVSGLAEDYDKNGQSLIKTTIERETTNTFVSENDLLNLQENELNYSSTSSPPINEEGVRMSLKQVTDSQRTISELSIGLVNAQQEVRKLKDNQTNLNRELSYYKEENKSLIERVAELEKQNQSLESLSSKERYIKELETKNKELNIEYEQVKNELFFAKKNIDELYRKLEYNESTKSISVYNKYSMRSESRIARHKTFANKKSPNYNKPRNIKDNGSSEFSFNSDSETKINDTILDMKEQNEKLILENETLHEEMEMLKNTLLDVQEDRENSSNVFLEKMQYQEKKYEDLEMKYRQIESEKSELLNHLENLTRQTNKDIPSDLSNNNNNNNNKLNSTVDESVIAEMKSLIADMEVTLTKTAKSEKEARSNHENVSKLYETCKVKMESLNHELDQMKMDYQLMSESNEALTRENEELKNTIEKLNQIQAQKVSSSNEELQNQYNKLQKQYEATKVVIEDKEAEMINYEVQCSQLEGQIIDFEKQLKLKQNEIDCLIEKYQTLQIANSSREWTNEEKSEVIHDQANKICMLEDTVKEVKDENNLLKIHNEESLNEISKLIQKKKDLELQITNKENVIKEKEVMQLENNTKEKEEMKEKENQIEELTRQNSTLSTEIKVSNEKLMEIQYQKDKVDNELEALNKRMSQSTLELKSLTAKYEESKKHYEEEIYELNKDREKSVQHAKQEIETIINQLTDTRIQFESKVNQLEASKQNMQKEYESEIEDLKHQLELMANLKQQTEQAENLLELSTLLDETERAKEVAESNAENRRKLLEKVIVERDQLSQDLQSEKEKFVSLKEEYDQYKKGINEIKQSNETMEKEREERQMLEKGYTLIWNSYLSLEKECEKLLAQLNQRMDNGNNNNNNNNGCGIVKNVGVIENNNNSNSNHSPLLSIKSSPALEKSRFRTGGIPYRNSYPTPTSTPKNKLNLTYDSIQDFTYDFDYISVPDSLRLIDRELKEDPTTNISTNKMKHNSEQEQENDKSTSIKTASDSQPYSPRSSLSPQQEGVKEKLQISSLSESSSNTLYSPKKYNSMSAFTKFHPLPRTNPNRILKSYNNLVNLNNPNTNTINANNNNASNIYTSLDNNDDTLYHKPEDDTEIVDYSSILQKSRNPSSSPLYHKYSLHN